MAKVTGKPDAMEFFEDDERYTKLQHKLLLELAISIRHTLELSGIDPSQIRELTESLTAASALSIDGSEIPEHSFLPVRPHVCFSGPATDGKVLHGGTTPLHELAPYAVEIVFEDE